jgi:hypothetical protein
LDPSTTPLLVQSTKPRLSTDHQPLKLYELESLQETRCDRHHGMHQSTPNSGLKRLRNGGFSSCYLPAPWNMGHRDFVISSSRNQLGARCNGYSEVRYTYVKVSFLSFAERAGRYARSTTRSDEITRKPLFLSSSLPKFVCNM